MPPDNQNTIILPIPNFEEDGGIMRIISKEVKFRSGTLGTMAAIHLRRDDAW